MKTVYVVMLYEDREMYSYNEGFLLEVFSTPEKANKFIEETKVKYPGYNEEGFYVVEKKEVM